MSKLEIRFFLSTLRSSMPSGFTFIQRKCLNVKKHSVQPQTFHQTVKIKLTWSFWDLSLNVNHLILKYKFNTFAPGKFDGWVVIIIAFVIVLCCIAAVAGWGTEKISFNQNNEFILSNIIDRKKTKSVCTIYPRI